VSQGWLPSLRIRPVNIPNNQFRLAFSPKPAKLSFMQFTNYSYYWRFTYRTTLERGASV